MQIYPDRTHPPHHESGFSLLEILVVLAIMSIMLVFVGTRMTTVIDATRFIRTAESAVADLQTLRVQSMLTQYEHIVVTQDHTIPPLKAWQDVRIISYDVPIDWKVGGDVIIISKHGLCGGGVVSFTSPEGRKVSFNLSAPSCSAERLI